MTAFHIGDRVKLKVETMGRPPGRTGKVTETKDGSFLYPILVKWDSRGEWGVAEDEIELVSNIPNLDNALADGKVVTTPFEPVVIDGWEIKTDALCRWRVRHPEDELTCGANDLEDAWAKITEYSAIDYMREFVPGLVALTKFLTREGEKK